jgi:hypothetical protein
MKRSRFRRRLAVWWWCVALATVATFALALASFPSYLRASGPEAADADVWLDSLYRTLQLFVLNWEASPRPIPWMLQSARFLAVFVALSTVILALCQLFRERLGALFLWRRHDHVVVCGLGQKGIDLVHDLRAQGQQVVVIEGQEDHPDLAGCRALGATVLVGPPADPLFLAQARVHRAATLLSLFQEDAASIETLMRAYRLNANRSQGRLRCILQVFDHETRLLLEEHETFKNGHKPVSLELFNLFDIGAQVMLRESPALFRRAEIRRLLLVGMGWMGQTLLQRVLRSWQIDRLARRQEQAAARPGPTGPGGKLEALEVIIVDHDGRQIESHPAAHGLPGKEDCNLNFQEMDVQGPDFLAGKYLPPQDSGNTIDAAFVCLPDDRLALLTAVRLRDRFGPSLPIVVRMTSRRGGAELLTAPGMESVHVVGLFDLAGTMPLVTNATAEMLAREFHRDYVLYQYAHGQTPETNEFLVPWHQLDQEMQDSNRQAAGHIDVKLKAVGCEKFPVRAVGELFEFTPDEVERLAIVEHNRWCEERRGKGWTFGRVKDREKKTSPALVPYDDLPDVTKEFNRTAIRRIPVWLAKAGFGIRRVADSPIQA